MAYTLQQIFEALGKMENGGSMVADLQDAISQARNEAAASRVQKNKVLDALGLRGEDTDEALKNLAVTLEALRKNGESPEGLGARIAAMQKQVEELTEKYTVSEKKAAEERAKRISTATATAIQNALTKGNALNPQEMSRLLTDRVKAKDDDSLCFLTADGKEVSIDDGVSGWLAQNNWAVKNTASGGAGSGSAGAPKKTYTMDDLKAMTADEINKNWDTISKGFNGKDE